MILSLKLKSCSLDTGKILPLVPFPILHLDCRVAAEIIVDDNFIPSGRIGTDVADKRKSYYRLPRLVDLYLDIIIYS